MKTILSLLALIFFINLVSLVSIDAKPKHLNRADEKAAALVHAALEAMGGEAKIRGLKAIRLEALGHAYAVEQSERPEGPFIVTYNQIKELRDLEHQRLRRTAETRNFQSPAFRGFDVVVADGVAAFESNGRSAPASIVNVNDAHSSFALAPERLFLTALAAPDLRLDKDTVMQLVPQHVIKFTWEKVPVTIYLNANTNLPTAVDTVTAEPYSHFWTIWGDITTRVYYTLWAIGDGGVRYPLQWDTEKAGYTFESLTISSLKVNEVVTDDQYKIADNVKTAFAAKPVTTIDELPLGLPNQTAADLAPDVKKIAGRWDVGFVKQTDGVVIIESPISSGYSVKVIEEAKKMFPGQKVKAVITTADAFPHFGGVREYAAAGIPIYALDVNRPIIERVLNTQRTFYPDNLARNSRKANIKYIGGKTLLGSGANRMEIYPFRTETGERMMMIYFPETKLLYSSDMIQPGRQPGTFAFPQYLSEVVDAVKRENLSVENVFGMHLPKTPWQQVADAVNKALGGA